MMNLAHILSILAGITEILVPGHPTCKVSGELTNKNDTLPILRLRLKDLQSLEETAGDPSEYLEYKKEYQKVHRDKLVALGMLPIASPYPSDNAVNMTREEPLNSRHFMSI